jgi:hypothetical protein
MNIGSLDSLSSSYLQSILSSSLQSTGSTTKNSSLSGVDASSITPADNGKLSPFAQVLSTLQALQQSDPTKYKQVTQQIAANLQSAASAAQADGNTSEADQLNKLASDFTSASTSGKLPNIQDLAQAMAHHHHHHIQSGSTDSDSVNQQLAAFQANGSTSDSLNPMSIVMNTLSSAGISLSQ